MEAFTKATVETLASRSPSREAFLDALLRLMANETKAISGIAWDCTTLPYRILGQIHSSQHDHVRLGVSEQSHVELLTNALEAQRSMMIKPTVLSGASKVNENPVILIVKLPFRDRKELVELFLPNDQAESSYVEAIKVSESICESAAGLNLQAYFSDDSQTASATRSSDVDSERHSKSGVKDQIAKVKSISPLELDEYVHRVHLSLDPNETAIEVANEARRLLDCDRVTVVHVHGRQIKVAAISGQPSVNHRSNTVQLLKRLASIVLPTREAFWFPSENSLPRSVSQPLNDYVDLANPRSLVIHPVFEVPAAKRSSDTNIVLDKPKLIAGIIIEEHRQEWVQDSVSTAVEVAVRHGADAIRNANQHRQLLFYPVWKWLGKARPILAARNLTKTSLAVISLLLASCFLCLWPADLKVACEGILVPANRSNVFVGVDGTVAEIKVTHGATVEKGDTLLRLENLELETRAAELDGQIRQVEQQIKTTETLSLADGDDDDQESSLNAQMERLASLNRQLVLVQQKIAKLNIVSPRDGKVVTWEIEDQLEQRPLTRGQHVMEVVDVDGQWELELELNDSKAGHVLDAWQDNGELAVEFILAADPERQFKGKVVDVGQVAQLSAEHGTVIPIRVEIEKSDLDIQQAKSGVYANVICDEFSIGYAWLHGVSEFAQKQWFRLF